RALGEVPQVADNDRPQDRPHQRRGARSRPRRGNTLPDARRRRSALRSAPHPDGRAGSPRARAHSPRRRTRPQTAPPPRPRPQARGAARLTNGRNRAFVWGVRRPHRRSSIAGATLGPPPEGAPRRRAVLRRTLLLAGGAELCEEGGEALGAFFGEDAAFDGEAVVEARVLAD